MTRMQNKQTASVSHLVGFSLKQTTIFLCLSLVAGASTAKEDTASVAEPVPCKLEQGEPGRVKSVRDGETLLLEDGRTVRLIGAMAPRTPDWWKKPEPWPPATSARKTLEALLLGRMVDLGYDGRRQDRHGRHLAHLYFTRGDERIWVQSALIERGLARAYSFRGNRACARALQRREAQARRARLGIWWRKTYAPLDAGEPKSIFPRLHSFQIVEGLVIGVKVTKRWTFVNFAADWKRDFTIAVKAKDRRLFRKSDIDLTALRGRRVRVRGWIESWNGPAIKVTHPEEIEIVPDEDNPKNQKKRNPASETPGSVDL